MYCMNCGAKNNDQAKFCIKCGQPLNHGIVTAIEKKNNPEKKKSRNWFMISVSLVLAVTIVIISVFDLWPWGAKVDNEATVARTEKESDGEQTNANTGAVTLNNFSLDAIIEQCPDCQTAIETYIAIIAASQDWMTSKETLEALENQKCAQMQHLCTAQAIYVEDIPYVYKGTIGLYTGDWLGAGPAGNGTYFGAIYDKDITSYTGEWGFGMPNGEGQLYLENYFGSWDMTYTGQMKNGMRDGIGSWFEYCDDGGYYESTYRIYDEAVYSRDQLTEWIDCVTYDAATGEIRDYCKMKTNEAGLPLMGEKWGPDELSPEEENILGIAGGIFIVGVTAYIVKEAIQTIADPHSADYIYKGKTPEEQMAELNRYREQKEEEEQMVLEREKKEREKQRAWAGSMLDRVDAGEITCYENDYKYYESLYYGE